MFKLTITVDGKTTGDLAIALDRIIDQVESDFTSGSDSNNSGRYSFQVEGEECTSDDDIDDCKCPSCTSQDD